MNPKELADLGRYLAYELDREARRLHVYSDEHGWLTYDAKIIRDKATDLLSLVRDIEVLEKLESSTLLTQITKLPSLASVDERVKQFEKLYDAYVDFAHAKEGWEVYFAAHRQKYVELWNESKRRERELQEKARILAEESLRREERRRIQYAEDLAFVKEKFSKPAHEAPCFAETRKNGLNCNRNDLVELKKLPTVFSTTKKISISIKRCSQCWQLYKECFVVDESTKQFRSRFLKPNETDAVHALQFSPAEAEEYNKTDLAVLVNPNLQMAETITERDIEATKKMSRTVYEESSSIKPNTPIEPFMIALDPLLRIYGVTGVWREIYVSRDYDGAVTSKREVLGDPQGAHLAYNFFWSSKSDGYSGTGGYKNLRGFQLVHSLTGEQLDLSIEIDLFYYTDDVIKLRFEGEESEVEKFKEAVKPALEDCLN